MPNTEIEDAPEAAEAETIVRPKRDVRERTKRKRQPSYAVLLHNDDVNGFEFVVGVLQKVFGYDVAKSFELTTTAHVKGHSIVWSGTLELAELKADQIRSCGADPNQGSNGALPLRVSIEPQE